ncbi:DUF2634 domain-containing protein [Vagococcus salmoninarum]|uniref:DUF2634 domain-containing protein n=1 Tax=Vagococcus salmoninarum TaxID=2739 RepID=UPI00187EFFCF|nr:DUF2634 domain-containing protein [Vagococcus salmoninarum]MBE9390003.1 DUF2634 domain-containing protein [Vagococcus salmoninarum]
MAEEIAVPTRTYKVINGRVAGFVEEQEAMEQAIEKVLSTERFAFEIYTESYGVEFSDLIGEQLDLVRAEVERVITEAIIVDDRVLSIENFLIIKERKDRITVTFEVSTVFGSLFLSEEVTL